MIPDFHKIVDLHAQWLTNGKAGKRADFSGFDFSGATIRDVDLSYAIFFRANFQAAELYNVKLYGAYLPQINLQHARLVDVDLRTAILRKADLISAKLYWVDLGGANLDDSSFRNCESCGLDLGGAVLDKADLTNANLTDVNLTDAILHKVILRGANLTDADLTGAVLFGADFTDAVLFRTLLQDVKGFYLLPVQDPRGRGFIHAVQQSDASWRIRDGHHNFTIEEAKNHWGDDYGGERWIGDMYLNAIDWLKKQLDAVDNTDSITYY